jgi:hypothetical protein
MELPITTSCYDALLRLRHRNRLATISVDSICINQSDDEEKSYQVQLMRSIYWKAKKVNIWLGPGNENSDYALDWLQSASLGEYPLLGVKFRDFPGNIWLWEVLKLLRTLPELTKVGKCSQELRLDAADFDQLWVAVHRLGFKSSGPDYKSEAIEDLTDRDWFKRMWTMQELVMAREPIVICGEKTIRWNNLHWGIVIARDFADNRNSSSFTTVFNSVVTVESLWLDLYRKNEWSEAQVTGWSKGWTELCPTLRHFFSFMHTYGDILTAGQILGILLMILIRWSSSS